METNTLFSVLIALGAGLGLYQVYRQAPARHADRRLDAAVLVLLAGLAGARAGFVLLNWSYYAGRPGEAFLIGNGGLSWIGALAGALLALPLAARLFQTRLPILADSVAHLLPPLGVMAWLACWAAGCGCGPVINKDLIWAFTSPDSTGLWAARYPVQPAAALLLAQEFLLAQSFTGPKTRAGLLAGRFGLALGLNLLWFSFFTGDPAPLYAGLRLSTWGAAALTLLSLAGMLAVRLGAREAHVPQLSTEERPVHSRT